MARQEPLCRLFLWLCVLVFPLSTSLAFLHAAPVTIHRGGKASPYLGRSNGSGRLRQVMPMDVPKFRLPHKLLTSSKSSDNADTFFDGRTTVALVGGQSLLIVGSVVIAALTRTPNFGLGPNFDFSQSALWSGFLLTLPLGVLAVALDIIEDRFPALQAVTKATQRSVLALLGGTFKPALAFGTSLLLGCVAGLGEEMLFRGILQYELTSRFGEATAVVVASIIFGALHAVTPLYATLAALASVYFGAIYLWSGNLAVPIVTHALYDLAALMYAHWTVSRLSDGERVSLTKWKGPGDV